PVTPGPPAPPCVWQALVPPDPAKAPFALPPLFPGSPFPPADPGNPGLPAPELIVSARRVTGPGELRTWTPVLLTPYRPGPGAGVVSVKSCTWTGVVRFWARIARA